MLVRMLILALLFAGLAIPQAYDPWRDFAEIWNPFADKINHGVFDAKAWPKVRDAFHRIEKSGW